MLDVGGQRSERRKWIHCFDCVTAVIFCSSLSEYDQNLREDDSQNRMKESLLLFDEIKNSPWFGSTPFVLFLNKIDLFREKIKEVSLNVCFEDFPDSKILFFNVYHVTLFLICFGLGKQNEKDGCEFIKNKFVSMDQGGGSNIFPHFTCAIDTKNVEVVFNTVKQNLLKKTLDDSGISF